MNDLPKPVVETGSPRVKESPSQEGAEPIVAGKDEEADQRLRFLYEALGDSQSIIRLLDAKAAFAVAVLSAMAGKIVSDLPLYFPLGVQPIWKLVVLAGFWILTIIAALTVWRVVFPVTNPVENVRLTLGEGSPQFFVWELRPQNWRRIWSASGRFSALAMDQQSFYDAVSTATANSLIKSLTGEVLKVSYIRQIKAERFRALGRFLIASAMLFIVLVVAQSLSPKVTGPQKVQVEGTVEIHDQQRSISPPPPDGSRRSTTPGKPGLTKKP